VVGAGGGEGDVEAAPTLVAACTPTSRVRVRLGSWSGCDFALGLRLGMGLGGAAPSCR